MAPRQLEAAGGRRPQPRQAAEPAPLDPKAEAILIELGYCAPRAFSFDEIGAALDLTPANARAICWRAERKLAARLAASPAARDLLELGA